MFGVLQMIVLPWTTRAMGISKTEVISRVLCCWLLDLIQLILTRSHGECGRIVEGFIRTTPTATALVPADGTIRQSSLCRKQEGEAWSFEAAALAPQEEI